MAESDWTAFTSSEGALDDGDVSKGVTMGLTPPSGGGTFVVGFHALQPATGFAGFYYSGLSAFNPFSPGKGGSVRCAMRRYAASTGYAPLMGLVAGTTISTANAYILGLSDSDPYQYVLRKGLVGAGLDPASSEVLAKSDETFSANTLWHHLRLDVVVNPQGDVVLNVYANDLTVNDVTAPSWEAVPGMDAVIDDGLGILTGSTPLVSGFRGFMGHYNDGLAGKVSLFDHFDLKQQNTP